MRLTFVACVVLAGCGAPAEKSDWERKHEAELARAAEEKLQLPAWPREKDLIEFYVAAASEFRFFVDPASVSVHDGGEVRYTLVAKSDAGALNVSYEGMRCASAEVRSYAIGRDGAWGSRPGAWRPIEPRSVQRWHNALYREYFCPNREPVGSRQEALAALRAGGNPLSRGAASDDARGAR